MTYDIYRYIFIGAAILCGIMFIVSVLLFIFMNIPKVISDLSGATARKAIKNIRNQNEASGDKAYKASAVNEARGRLTDKITPSGNIVKQYSAQGHAGIETAKISTQQLPVEEPANETTVLGGANETTVLGASSETTILGNASETTVLSHANETSVLDQGMVTTAPAVPTHDAMFAIEYEITFIHTNEIIATEATV